MTPPRRSTHPYLSHPGSPGRPGPLAFAHRGGAGDGLENTAAAFRSAADLGYRYFETDVHTTADGRLVAFHDEKLDRVTDAQGRIGDLSWAEVGRARVAGREPLPLFEDLLAEFPDVRWNVDMKAPSALGPLLDLIRATGSWDRVCVGSFCEARVARAARLAGPRLATSYGTRGVLGLRLRSLGLPAPVRRGAVCAQVPLAHAGIRVVDRRFVALAHARGLQVHVWTVNDPHRAGALLDLGVDGIMTDQLEMLRTVFESRGVWR